MPPQSQEEISAEGMSAHLRRVHDCETMFSLLQEAGAWFGVVVTWEGMRRRLPELWRAVDDYFEKARQEKYNLVLCRSLSASQREKHAAEIGRFSQKLDELRQENETLRQRLSVYEPAEGQP